MTKFFRVIPILIAINIAVFLAWHFSGNSETRLLFLEENFLVSFTGILEGRVWILLTSVFSHNLVWHILLNMFVLNSFGPIVEEVLGSFRFLRFYLTAGIFSSLTHALVSAYIIGDPSLPALGASGAISGLILLFSFIFPKEKILVFGVIPVPAIWGALLFMGIDIWGLVAQAGGGGLPIGHGAHLGGAVVGIIYFLMIRKHLRRRV